MAEDNGNILQTLIQNANPLNFLGSIVEGVGGIFNNERNISESRKAREWQSQMQQQAQNWEEMMWNKTNDWNSAENVLGRELAADEKYNINPYAKDIAASPAQNLSSPGAPSTALPNIQNPVQGLVRNVAAEKEMQLIDAQRENIEADTDYKRVQAEHEAYKIALTQGQIEYLGYELDFKPEENQYKAAKYGAEIANLEADTQAKAEKIAQDWAKLDLEQQKLFWQQYTDTVRLDIEKGKLSIEEKQLKIDMYNAFTQRMVAESNIEVNDARIVLYSLEGDKVVEETMTMKEYREKGGVAAEAKIKSSEAKYADAKQFISCAKGVCDCVNSLADTVTDFIPVTSVGKSVVKAANGAVKSVSQSTNTKVRGMPKSTPNR
ncbi:minor capsid protein [Capybara microvirus Cap3_SP_367]|nr:minor capsid protein [Capybara microvirus Cap3_SP_367]